VKRHEFRLELAESWCILPEWASIRRYGRLRGQGGLIRFYRQIAGVGLAFPSGRYPFAYPVAGMEDFIGFTDLLWPIEARDGHRAGILGRARHPPVPGVLGGGNGQRC
jgi:hypothetical protein